jgi:23S rRNA (cytidine1920-2'-O)/16S rRNA (cytidine1409-2'-O)-methyltransferase
MKSFHARTPRARPHQPIGADAEAPLNRPMRPVGGFVRADALLVERGLASSRTAAQRLIEAGRLAWRGAHGDETIAKSSHLLPPDAEIVIAAGDEDRYVSRGGLKLAGALGHCRLDVRGKTCLDVGQSTGGFTDCLLQAGAARVVGLDVGHGQLHPRLRADARVVCLEGVNARALDDAPLPSRAFDLIVGDLSFISLTLVLPQLPPLLNAAGEERLPRAQPSASLPPKGAEVALGRPGGDLLLLVKPQFEVGPRHVGKGGIVRDAGLYPQVEMKLRNACAALHLAVQGWFESPIPGGDGNREFFLWAKHEQA